MARNAVASSSKAPIKIKKGSAKPIVTVSEPGTDADEYTDEEYDDGELEFDAQDEEEEGVAQYAPDDWDGEDDDDASSSEGRSSRSASDDEGENEDADDLRKLQENLRSMPLSTLMKAQKSLKSRPARDVGSDESGTESDSEGQGGLAMDARAQRLAEAKKRLAEMQRRKGKAGAVAVKFDNLEDEEGSEDEFADMRQQKNGSRGEKDGPKREKIKRDNKHAPTAMSTKKQVSRMRQVVESVGKNDRRDPRFDTMSSSAVDPNLQSQSYSFLPKILKDELAGLRTAVQMATKAERHCPLADKPARIAERQMLELELGKLRTKIERGEREAKERETLSKVKKVENEKRKEGKGAWYMKKNEQKDLLLKARFENLEKQGGQKAVKKAQEKKRKKEASKEKKSRPFAKGSQGGAVGGPDGKRRRVA